ncbi:DUF4349 domain-containing protein [Plantibacter sp. YIM 135249]|uniref:DUF4349 domain-containing protein n=1 Tax=Plantibacter sp. YIM 135249 TaxID=3423918 RepID=UPI003D3355FE
MRRMTSRRRTAAVTSSLAIVLAAGLLLSGCSLAGSSAPGTNGGGTIPVVPMDPQVKLPGAEGGGIAPDGSASDASGTARNGTSVQPQVVTTGSLTLTDADPAKLADKASKIVLDAGGRVDTRDESPAGANQTAQANLTVRIPKDDFDRVLDDMKALGIVTGVSISTVDVTTQAADLDARITALQASVDRLLALMKEATSTADLLAAETSLSERQAELDGLVAQRDALGDQVDYSSVYISVIAPGTAGSALPSDFWGGLVAGWNALLTAGSGLVVVIGFLAPWIGLLLVLGLVVLLVIRLALRRPRQRSGPSAPPAHPAGRGPHPAAPAQQPATPAQHSQPATDAPGETRPGTGTLEE